MISLSEAEEATKPSTDRPFIFICLEGHHPISCEMSHRENICKTQLLCHYIRCRILSLHMFMRLFQAGTAMRRITSGDDVIYHDAAHQAFKCALNHLQSPLSEAHRLYGFSYRTLRELMCLYVAGTTISKSFRTFLVDSRSSMN